MFFQDEIEEEAPFWGVRQEEQGEGYCLLVTVQVEGVIGLFLIFFAGCGGFGGHVQW